MGSGRKMVKTKVVRRLRVKELSEAAEQLQIVYPHGLSRNI